MGPLGIVVGPLGFEPGTNGDVSHKLPFFFLVHVLAELCQSFLSKE
jgi:hypothetical protein